MSTRAQLLAEIAAQFPDNTTGLITPAKLRQVTEDLANSCAVPAAGTGSVAAEDITNAGTAGIAAIKAETPAQLREAAGAAAAATSLFGRIDAASLLPRDLSTDIWTPFQAAYISTAALTNDTDSGVMNGVLLNGAGNAASGGHRTAYFLAPAGATSVTLTVRAKRPTGVASATLGISIRTGWNSGTELGIAQCVLGATEADYSVSANVTAGTAYLAMVATNYTGYPTGGGSSSQAKAVVTSVKLTSNATGFWATNFLRVEPDPAAIRGSRRAVNTATPVMSFRDAPMANWTVETDATTAVVEYYPEDTSNPIGVEWTGGGATITPDSSGSLRHATVSLPEGPKEVTFFDGMKITNTHSGISPLDNPTLVGALIRCVYFNAGASVKFIRRGAERKAVAISDSILSGVGAVNSSFTGALGLLARLMPCEVAQEGADALSVYQVAHNSATATAYAKRVAMHRPSDVIVAIGVNDYAFATDTATNFGTDYGVLLDALRTWNPGARIWAVAPIIKATETANSKGNTLTEYRTAIASAVSSRSWATLIDAASALLATDLADGLHPNPGGHDKLARFIRGQMIA